MNENLIKILDALIPLFSTIVGGGLTYCATRGLDNRKLKMKMKTDALEKVLIPYATCLEQVTIPRDKNSYYKGNFHEFREKLNDPLEYLVPAKRMYLSKKNKKLLDKYRRKLKDLDNQVELDKIRFKEDYSKYVNEIILGYKDLKFEYNNVHIKYNEELMNNIECTLVNESLCRGFINGGVENINSITFEFSDDKASDVKEITLVRHYYIDDYINNFVDTNSTEYKLTKYLYSNINIREVENLAVKYSCKKLLGEVVKTYEDMKSRVIKEIDKIVGT